MRRHVCVAACVCVCVCVCVCACVLSVLSVLPPSSTQGCWTFPGGGLELGETMVECAIREMMEETGIAIRNSDPASSSKVLACTQNPRSSQGSGILLSCGSTLSAQFWSQTLATPTVYAGADSIHRDAVGSKVRFHYAILEVAAMAADPLAEPVAGDDAEAAAYFDIDEVAQLPGATLGFSAKLHLEAAVADPGTSSPACFCLQAFPKG